MADLISIEVVGAERLEKALTGVARDFEDLRPAWKPVSDEIYSIVEAQFASQGGRGAGGRWPARSEVYLDRLTSLNRKGFATVAEPLRLTGRMYTSVTRRGAPGGIYEETQDSLTVGTSVPYAKYHQTGTGKMAQRRIYDLTERDGVRLLSIVKKSLMGKIADRGFDFVAGPEIAF